MVLILSLFRVIKVVIFGCWFLMLCRIVWFRFCVVWLFWLMCNCLVLCNCRCIVLLMNGLVCCRLLVVFIWCLKVWRMVLLLFMVSVCICFILVWCSSMILRILSWSLRWWFFCMLIWVFIFIFSGRRLVGWSVVMRCRLIIFIVILVVLVVCGVCRIIWRLWCLISSGLCWLCVLKVSILLFLLIMRRWLIILRSCCLFVRRVWRSVICLVVFLCCKGMIWVVRCIFGIFGWRCCCDVVILVFWFFVV